MIYKSIKQYKRSYEIPVILKKNDKIEIIKNDDEYKNWYWCKNNNIYGWVPGNIIDFESNTIIDDYNSIELNVNSGDELFYIKEYDGWILFKNSINETGWLPEKIVKIIK